MFIDNYTVYGIIVMSDYVELVYSRIIIYYIEVGETNMTNRYRICAVIIAIITVVISTYGGVLASQKLDSFSFGSLADYESLDTVDSNVGMVNVLIIGVDEGENRSDTIMLASLDGYSNRVNILSIPRDTMVTINGTTQKINAAMAISALSKSDDSDDADNTSDDRNDADDREDTDDTSGDREDRDNGDDEGDGDEEEAGIANGSEDALINMIKSLTGLPIHYFVTVNFNAFIELIDAVDGVDFDVPYDMDYDDPVQDLHIHLTAGEQHLDGQLAHDFVRYRHNNDGSAPGEYVMGDEGRIHWQQEFIKELINQKLNAYYLSKIGDIYDVFKDNVKTNLTFADVLKNLNALSKISVEDINAYQLPGESEYTNDLWYYVQDREATAELISNVFRPQSREEWEAYLAEQESEDAE